MRRGDTVMFTYVPRLLPEQQVCARARILRVQRDRGTLVVRAWNGALDSRLLSQYEELELPLAAVTLISRRQRKKQRQKSHRKPQR